MTFQEANKFIDEYASYTGKDLNEVVKLHPQLSLLFGNGAAFVQRVERIITEEIKYRAPLVNLDDMSDIQKAALRNAITEQITYTVASGDFSLISGYNDVDNTSLSTKEIRQKMFSPLAIKILTNAGLLYSGLDRAVVPCWLRGLKR